MPSLRANHGNKKLIFDIGSAYSSDEGIHFHCDFRFVGEYWDGDHAYSNNVNFDGLSLKRDEVLKLCEHLRGWLNQPLDKLITNDLRGSFELANVWGQSVRLIFGPRADTIDERKQVVTAELKVAGVSVEMHFVTDQSCLSIFLNELDESIAKSTATI